MCGILGEHPATDPRRFQFALNLLSHRGPDDEGIWQSPENEIMLGHRRLSIIDLTHAASQPMHSPQYSITYNGEIYNYPELRADLEKSGYQFTTQSDTEVLLNGFHHWGTALFEKLNGMWALALWDRKEHQLFLSRDRFGKKPLFYIHNGDRFVFASEMKALVPFLSAVEPNEKFIWMRDHIFDYEPTDECLIKGIKRFPQASWGVFKINTLSVRRYWDTMEHLHSVPQKYPQQVEEFRAVFMDAVRLRMRASVPVGTALSGGIDSASVFGTMAHVAARHPEPGLSTPDWRHAVVASMPGTPLDETQYARDVAGFTAVDLDIITIDPVQGLADLPDYLYQLEELYITSPVPMMQLYRRMRDTGIFVSLDGHGADELFSGYDTFLFNVFQDCGLNPWRIKNILNTYRGLVEPGQDQFVQNKTGFIDYLIQATGDNKLEAILPKLKSELMKGFSNPPHMDRSLSTREKWDRMGNLNRKLFQLFHRDNLPTLLRNYDRFSMASGVEIRMPFLDHRVVNYCFSVSWQSKVRNGYTKALLRDACQPMIPNTIYRRTTKMGFQSPIVDWLKGPWKEFFLDTVHSTEFNQSEFIDPEIVRSKIENVIFGESPTYRQGELAYASLSPFLWEKFVLSRFRGKNR